MARLSATLRAAAAIRARTRPAGRADIEAFLHRLAFLSAGGSCLCTAASRPARTPYGS